MSRNLRKTKHCRPRAVSWLRAAAPSMCSSDSDYMSLLEYYRILHDYAAKLQRQPHRTHTVSVTGPGVLVGGMANYAARLQMTATISVLGGGVL